MTDIARQLEASVAECAAARASRNPRRIRAAILRNRELHEASLAAPPPAAPGAAPAPVPEAAPAIVLVHGQIVRLASWMRLQKASVFTIAGYAKANGLDPAEMVAREKGFGRSIAPNTINTGTTLHNSAALRVQEEAEFATATTIEDGQIVEIEGESFRVQVRRGNGGTSPRNSDPIGFVPV